MSMLCWYRTIPSRLLCRCRYRITRSKANSKRAACCDSLSCARQTCRKGKSYRCNSTLIGSIALCINLRFGIIARERLMSSQIPFIIGKLAYLRDAVSDFCPLMGMRTRCECWWLTRDVIPREIKTAKFCGYVVNSAAESLDSIGIRNTSQVCIRIASF